MIKAQVDWVFSNVKKTKKKNEDNSIVNSTGDQSAATNTGYQSAATNTGDRSAAEVKGKYAVAIACGIESRAKADENGCIVICDWQYKDNGWVLDNIYSAKVGGKIKRKTIKANTWYWFEKGKLMEEEV